VGVSPPPDPNRVVFNHMLAALVHGSGYERIATPGRSDRTIRRRLLDWAERDVGVELLKAALAAYNQMIGLDLDDLSSDGSITNRPEEGNFRVGPRSIAVSKAPNARWSPTGAASPSPRSAPAPTGTTHRWRAMTPPRPGTCSTNSATSTRSPARASAPIQVGKRWVVERTHSWINGYGKIRRCTEKRRSTVEFSLHLAAALTVLRRLINEARTRYRWPARPTTRRLK